MANTIEVEPETVETSKNPTDPVKIAARLLNLILEMPVAQQLELLGVLDNCRYSGVRKHPRKKSALPVDLEVKHHTFKETTRDISKGGLYIETQTSFPVNQEVTLTLQLPHKSEPIAVVGEIVRATSQGIAIKFKRYVKHPGPEGQASPDSG